MLLVIFISEKNIRHARIKIGNKLKE